MNLRSLLALWFGVRAPVTRSQYIASGLVLAVIKYAVEAGVILALTGNWLTPLDFLNPSLAARQAALEGGPEWFGWVLFAWNLPFVWIALSMSVRRAAGAGLPPWLGLAVLVPVAGLAAFDVLPHPLDHDGSRGIDNTDTVLDLRNILENVVVVRVQ